MECLIEVTQSASQQRTGGRGWVVPGGGDPPGCAGHDLLGVAIGDWDFNDTGEYVDWSLVSDDPPPVWWTEKFAPGQPTFDTIRVPGP